MHGNDAAFFIVPVLAIFLILRRGFRQSRVRPGGLFVYPLIICLLVAMTFVHQKMPTMEMMAVLAVAALVGVALGWITTAHLQLSVDPKKRHHPQQADAHRHRDHGGGVRPALRGRLHDARRRGRSACP